jgi:hypothetical protein
VIKFEYVSKTSIKSPDKKNKANMRTGDTPVLIHILFLVMLAIGITQIISKKLLWYSVFIIVILGLLEVRYYIDRQKR